MSDDLIKRSDAIKTVCECECYSGVDPCPDGEGCYPVNELRRIPSADRAAWIPCSERLPEYRKTVLISTFWGVKTGFLDGTEAYGDFWEIIEDDATAALHSVYAWMPLPEPYHGGEEQ